MTNKKTNTFPALEQECTSLTCYKLGRSTRLQDCDTCAGSGVVLTEFGTAVLDLCTRWLDVSTYECPTSEGNLMLRWRQKWSR